MLDDAVRLMTSQLAADFRVQPADEVRECLSMRFDEHRAESQTQSLHVLVTIGVP